MSKSQITEDLCILMWQCRPKNMKQQTHMLVKEEEEDRKNNSKPKLTAEIKNISKCMEENHSERFE